MVLGTLHIVIVCSCHAVNEGAVKATLLAGATCPEDVAAMCGAGTDCGSCVRTVEDIIDEHHETHVQIGAGGAIVAA